jgi:hypothetical protein
LLIPVSPIQRNEDDEVRGKVLDRETAIVVGGPAALDLDAAGPSGGRIAGVEVEALEVAIRLRRLNPSDQELPENQELRALGFEPGVEAFRH